MTVKKKKKRKKKKNNTPTFKTYLLQGNYEKGVRIHQKKAGGGGRTVKSYKVGRDARQGGSRGRREKEAVFDSIQ